MKDKLLKPFRFIAAMWRYARDMHRVVSISRDNRALIEGEGLAFTKHMKDDHFYHVTLIDRKSVV